VRSTDGKPVPVQVDGDYVADETEVRFAVEPGALRVVA
jgi:diacylglycerol kinase family enzyme